VVKKVLNIKEINKVGTNDRNHKKGMSSIAALSAKVREKDAEKSKILNEIKDLEGLKSQTIVGELHFVVQTAGNVSADYSVDLKVTPTECNLSITKLTNLVCSLSSSSSSFSFSNPLQTLGKEIQLQLSSKNISIEIICRKSEKEYVSAFDLNEVPDNNSLSTQLDGLAAEGETIPIHVKVSPRLQFPLPLLRLTFIVGNVRYRRWPHREQAS
jgi:hypothetical protein